MTVLLLEKSPIKDKKYRVTDASSGKTVDFGGKGYSDYTIHKDPERMKRYLTRHQKRENWSKKNGLWTAGFWSRWLLWSKPDFQEAKKFVEKKFGLKLIDATR